MSGPPRDPDDLPANNGHSGPAGSAAAAHTVGDDRRDALPSILASYWAMILRRFRDYVRHIGTGDGNGHRTSGVDRLGQ